MAWRFCLVTETDEEKLQMEAEQFKKLLVSYSKKMMNGDIEKAVEAAFRLIEEQMKIETIKLR